MKDNRIRPQGYDPAYFLTQDSQYIRALAKTAGRAGLDPDYIDPNRTGVDEIEYVIKLAPKTMRRVHSIQVTLYNQSIPPFYLQQRFNDASKGPAEKTDIERLYYMTSHLNVDQVEDNKGNQVMEQWKLFINRASKKLQR